VKTRTLVAPLLVLALVAGLAAFADAQCAMCKTVLEGSAEGRTMQGELNRAILLMIAAPYVVFGTLLAVFFRKPLAERIARLAARVRRVPASS